MKLETFFSRFDDLVDTPNAVVKMRELILQLATHGKLVEQSSGDEPASALVSKIAKHIALLRSRKEFRGSPVEPLDRDELPVIPSSWEWVRLGNVVDYGSSDKAESAEIPEDAWLLDLEDIEKDTSRLLQRKSFRDSPSKSTKTAFAVRDVLYGKLRPYLNKVIVADAPGYCTTEIIPIRAFGFIDPMYLCHALKRPEFIAYANSKSYGMNLPRLGTEDARSAPFPLPPLAEQKRIVAKVDELMALCDRLEAQQKERETRHAALARASLARFADAPTPANLQFLFHPSFAIPPADLRKSILTLAVQGKIVPQDPNDEPAEELLERIDISRNALLKAGIVPKQKPLADIGESECQHSIPKSWEWVRLQRAAEIIDPNPSHRMPRYCVSGVPFISTENFVGREEIDFSIGKQVDQAQLEEQKKGFTIRPGSFALSRIGTIGKTRMLPLERSYCMSHALVVIAPYSEDIDSKFLRMVVTSDAVQGQASHGAKSIGVPDLGMGKIRSFVAPLPPLAEQRRIVAKVEQLMALVDALETQLAASRATAANLLSALVAELTQGRALA